MRPLRSAAAAIAALGLAAAIAGCGGTQTVGAAPASYLASSATETASTTATTVYPLIGTSGVDDTLTLPAASAAVPVTETISIAAPSGVTPLSGLRAAAAVHPALVTTTPVAYLQFTSTAAVTIDGFPGITFTLTSITAGATYGLALETSEGFVPTGQTAAVSGSSVTFAPAAGSFAIAPTAPVTFVLYSTVSTATATPSASPSPSPAPSLSPAALVFDQTTPGLSQNLTVTNAGTGAVSGVIACTASAEGSPSPEPSSSPTADPNAFVAEFAGGTTASITPTAGTAVFAVTGGDELGTCTVVLTPAGGSALTATVEVDAVTGGLYSVHRVKH